jgi:ferrochelatase
MNLGGPASQSEVEPFLRNLFSDPELIRIPFQKRAAEWIARRRSPKVAAQYAKIGGGSPIKMWTQKQIDGLVKLLDEQSPETGKQSFILSREGCG